MCIHTTYVCREIGRVESEPPGGQPGAPAEGGAILFILGFGHNFTSYNFKQTLEFQTNIDFHPSGNIYIY